MVKTAISSIAAVWFVLACGSLPDAPVTESTAADFAESPTLASVTPTGTAITETTNPPAAMDVTAMPSPTPIPLQVVVPPCIPFPTTFVDPCERRDSWDDFTPNAAEVVLHEVVPAVKNVLFDLSSNPAWSVHFGVRATAIPGSVRCGNVVTRFYYRQSYERGEPGLPRPISYCYVDLAVNEYLFGNGPAIVTASLGENLTYFDPETGCGAQCREVGEVKVRRTGIEGVEWIMLLGGPYDLAQSAWGIGPTYDVQQRQDGTVVVVRRYKNAILANSTPENYALNESRLEWTLDDFRQVVSDAFAAFVELTDGRTGTENDWAGRPPPKLATDAGPDGFNDFLMRTGLIEDLPQAPPPIPDDGRRNPDRLRINDIIATRVAGGSAE